MTFLSSPPPGPAGRDVRVKLAWLVLCLTAALTLRSSLALAAVPAACLLVSLAGRSPLRLFLAVLPVVALLAVQLGLLQLVFNREGEVLLTLGPLPLHAAALPKALRATLRLSGLLVASMQFYSWTPPADLVQALVKARVPYRYATLAGLALRFLPEMEREFRAVSEAQASRGLRLDGPVHRLRSLLPLAVPFLFRSLRRGDDVALALELRGFGVCPRRTFPHELRLSPAEAALTGLLLLAAVLVPVSGL